MAAIGMAIVPSFTMWKEIDYSLATEQGIRHLVLQSNYEQVERGLIDHGDYSVWEDLTPFDTMSDDEVDAHFEKAGHWDAEPYIDTHGVYLGMLHVDLSNPQIFTWDGKPEDLNLAQQAQLVEYLTNAEFEPELTFEEDEAGEDVFATIPFEGKEGLQVDGSIMVIETFKSKVIRVRLVPQQSGYQIYFDDEPVGLLLPAANGSWKTQHALFQDDNLVARLGMVI
ncbi:hypothetical protein GCM10023149_29290 [Mucilaginibacter gynuensis]|uniref:Uncharacterized protein n=1 Tax=Mucilaginibacter gynuensis TaxID=1302236 RepID=A0ABP8GL94_9SPHI